jgi:hypothetical protein
MAGILLRMHRHPDFFAGRGVNEFPVTAFALPIFDVPSCFEFLDDFTPRHDLDDNPSLGYSAINGPTKSGPTAAGEVGPYCGWGAAVSWGANVLALDSV